MNSAKVFFGPAVPQAFVVRIKGAVTDMMALNQSLAERLVEELQDHFRKKNAVPNKLDGVRSNFWNQLADATQVVEVRADGATVSVADHRFRIHVTGGTVVPLKAKALTIPLIAAAYGLRASSYAQKFNRRLFTIKGRHALFERTDANATESVTGQTNARVRGSRGRTLTIPLAARSGIRPVYALVASAKIPADPTAAPSDQALATALQQEVDDYFTRTLDRQ